jgi:HK97 family phage major capsid protein
MTIKWPALVDQIRESGYSGGEDDFAAVVAYLKENHHDPDFVTDDEGNKVSLKTVYDARPPKPFSAGKAAERSRFDEAVDERAKELLNDAEQRGLVVRPNGEAKGTKVHDVKVGKDRLADSPTGGFKHFGQYVMAVKDHDTGAKTEGVERLVTYCKALSTYGSEGIGTDGGFAVPPEYANEIMVMVQGEDSLLSRTRQFPLSRNAISLPTDEVAPWDTSNGVTTAWEGEAGTIAQSKPQLTLKELRLRKLTCLVPVTEELLEDGLAMGSYVSQIAGEKLDFAVGEAIFRGTGAGQPKGFMNSGSLISVTKETLQVASTIVGPNITKMWSRMYAPYRRNAVWLVNPEAEPELMRLAITGRTDGGTATTSFGAMIWMPANGISGLPYNTMFGRPVLATQHCAALGTVGDIVLADLTQYISAVKSGGVESSSSIHLWFDQDAVAFKFRLRMDGQPWRDTTISARTGNNTLSAFVAVATRS